MVNPNPWKTSRNIDDAHQYLRITWPTLAISYTEKTGFELILTCVYRTIEEQKRLYAIGRTVPGKVVTYCDGVDKKSKHNDFPSRAIDVAVMKGGKISWETKDYDALEEICKRLKLVWGGLWPKPKTDRPHIELPKQMV